MTDNDLEKPNNSPEEPDGVLDLKELSEIDQLAKRYQEMTSPGFFEKAGGAFSNMLPDKAKETLAEVGSNISGQQFYRKAMDVIANGFGELEKQAAKYTISEKTVIEEANKQAGSTQIRSLEEVCFLRSYQAAKIADTQKLPNLGLALAEGGGTGFFGFAGIVPNIVTSTFCYYRAVQSIAMSYGYNTKSDPDELMIAGEVFTTAMAPKANDQGEVANIIGKIMMITEAEAINQTVKKGWTEMASRGGTTLLLTQMRALAHKAAKKALEKAGKEGLENNVFRSVLEQIGKRLTAKTIQRAVPLVSALIGALFDFGEMKKVLEFADIFYRKRFLLEKAERQRLLLKQNESGDI